MKNNYINHFNYSLNSNHVDGDGDNQTILSSVFTYYNGQYDIIKNKSTKSFNTKLTKNFTDLLHSKNIYNRLR